MRLRGRERAARAASGAGLAQLAPHLRARGLLRTGRLTVLAYHRVVRPEPSPALPILQRHGVRATFFISTGYVTERRVFWWDRLQDVVARARPGRFTLAQPEPLTLDLTTGSSRQAALLALLGVVKQRPGLDVDRFLDDTASSCGVRLGAGEEEQQASDLVMSWDHVRALHEAGMDVQSHSRSHRVLTTGPPRVPVPRLQVATAGRRSRRHDPALRGGWN